MYRDRQYDVSRELIQYLVALGIDYFCISPGSRSTPITLSLAKETRAKKAIFYDERAAGYHAVGYARATGKPAVLVCTSGTAPANYFPAVMEANNDCLPLIILSADRPFELYETGANQTVNQQNLYGSHAGKFANIETYNSADEGGLDEAKAAVNYAFQSSKPVQINLMYKKPLEPSEDYNFYNEFSQTTSASEITSKVIEIEADLLIIGELNYVESQFIKDVLSKSEIPVYADIRSGLRNFSSKNSAVAVEKLLRQQYEKQSLNLAFIGGKLVNQKLTDAISTIENISLSIFTFRGQKSEIFAKAESISHISIHDNVKINSSPNIDIASYEDNTTEIDSSYSDYNICKYIFENAEEHSCIFSGNSMSIRNFDIYSENQGESLFFAANRGASGIDGNISSAIGMAAGLGDKAKRLICVVGDLTAIHDLNSLSTIQYAGMPVTIVVINNHGGSIFSKLPVSKYKEEFGYWQTPHSFNFKGAAEMFGLNYHLATDFTSFRDIFSSATNRNVLIETLV
jgi:2-succinyl-5-enolpyruvyl-6-hydroxy-3-cyclohexene-1-carboxylate synthase